MRDDLEQLCAAQAEKYGQGPLEMRLEIQGLVRSAQITPEDAEDWLREWPHEAPEDPFAVEPDPAKFDPMRETYWSLGMATAWVLWRSMDAVREEWEDFVTERTLWVKINERDAFATAPNGYVEAKGHELRAGAPKGAWGVLSFARANSAGLTLSAADGEHELVGALQRGDLIAIHGRDQHVAEIPELKWAGLSPFSPGREALPDAVYARGEHRPTYSCVKVRHDVLTRLWPPTPCAAPIAVEAAAVEAPAAVPSEVGEVPSVEATASHDVSRSLSEPRVKARRSMDGAHKANAEKSAAQVDQRLKAIDRIVRERGYAPPIKECVRLLKLEFGEDFPASKPTVQPELKAAKDRLAEKK